MTTSCAQKKNSPPLNQTLRLNLSDDPISLDPRVVRSLKDLTVVKQLFEGLMRIDQSGVPQLALAKSVEISEDFLTYTFHLRESYWNNHDPVTAYDFEYAWTKVLEHNFASDYSYMLYPIKNAQLAREGKCLEEGIGVMALDDRTLVVQLHTPTPYFLELVAFPTYFPINHKVDMQQKKWALPPGDQFVCNGPFCLQKWTPQTDLILEKNPLYWDSPGVYLDKIAFLIIPDNNTENYLFEKEELDWLGQPLSNNITTEMLNQLRESGTLHSYTVAGTLWFEFNVEKEPFDSEKLRKALSYSINRQEIIEHILQGNQRPATGPLPPSMAVQTTPYFVDADKERAQILLKEALLEIGLTLETLPKIFLSYHPTERNTKIAQLVQQQWRSTLGFEVELQSVERQLYRNKVRQGHFQIGIGEWIADFNDPVAFLELFKYKNNSETGSGMNGTGWQNEAFVSLLNQSLTESDLIKRTGLLRQAEQILMDEMPIAPVYHYAFDYVKKDYVHDVVLSPLGPADFKTTRLVR